MPSTGHSPLPDDVASHVRRNVLPSAIAAVLMMYYGFNVLLEPQGSDLFSQANWLLYQTLRIGGVAMAAVAVASLVGHRSALLADAVVSGTVGLLLALSGVAMLLDGGSGLQCVLYIVFGAMFLSAGWRNGRDFFQLSSPLGQPSNEESRFKDISVAPFRDSGAPAAPTSSLAGALRKRMAESRDAASPQPGEPIGSVPLPETHHRDRPLIPVEPDTTDQQTTDVEEPESAATAPPEKESPPDSDGFLASFSDDGPPPKI